MKRTIDLLYILFALTLLSWYVRAAVGAEPKVEVAVTTTKSGNITVIDARRSVGELTWKISEGSKHEFVFGGDVCICEGAYTLAIVAVEDGKVDVVLLQEGGDTSPPPAGNTLAGKVRRLSAGLPKDERQQIAKIYANAAAQFRVIRGDNPQAVRDAMQAVIDARSAAMAELTVDDPTAWNVFQAALAKLLRAENLSSVDPQAQAKAYEAIAEGLQ